MKKIITFGLLFCFFSCDQKKQETKNWINEKIKIWQQELVLNGQVGMPCQEDYMKWNAKNPEAYYGLPTYIYYRSFDANQDQIPDYLLYFPAGNCCTGGHEEGSDFVKLIYSNKETYLENNQLRDKIEYKIKEKANETSNQEARKVVFTITNFSTNITGSYNLWTTQDPDCCSSSEGTFTYNPFTFKIKIEALKNKN